MSTEITLRSATIEDADELAALGAKTFSDSFGTQNRPEDMADYLTVNFSPQILAQQLEDDRATFRVAERGGIAVGYTMLRQSAAPEFLEKSESVELVRIYVDRPLLGSGLGSRLMQDCLDQVQEQGFQTIWLGVWERNARAISFYKRWGFSIVGEHEFVLGTDVQNDYLMVRSLVGEEG